jgi:predicted DNA-binding WGR domain protein
MRFPNRRDSQSTRLHGLPTRYHAPRHHRFEEIPHMQIDARDKLTGPSVVLDRIRPAQNQRRFYAASVTADLFGNILLFRNWGRIGTAGCVRFDLYSCTPKAMTALEKLHRRKHRRGYKNRDHCLS